MWQYALLCLALVQVALGASVRPHAQIHLKPLKTSADRIREHGYPAESHYIETSDGYVVNAFRIPYSHKLNNQAQRRPVVFIQHGFISCSDCFLLNGPDDAIAYNFADAGYDVWLGNARGNIYSRNNTKMSVDHPYFWDFSWHEIGAIDVAAMIDYILELTGEPSLHYVGHSQGGTVFFVLMSWRPEYNDKISTAHMLAPAVFMGNSTTAILARTAPYVGAPGKTSLLLEGIELLPNNPVIQRALDTACGGEPQFPEYCETLFLMWAGDDLPNMNMTIMPQIAETHPAGVSSSQGIHYVQSYNFNSFKVMDRGPKKNLKLYSTEVAPDYPLEKITSPVHIYYGLNDGSANKADLQRLQPMLPNLKLFHEVPIDNWGHLDFIFAMRVKEMINDKVIGLCTDYENENKRS